MTIIKSIPLLYLWLSSSRYLCCIDDYHQVIYLCCINDYHQSIPLLYYDYHQVDTSAVFMTIIKSIPLMYVWLSSSRYLCCIYDYHQVDTSAVFMTIIKSIPLLYLMTIIKSDTSAVFMTIIKSIPLLYLWLSSSRYLWLVIKPILYHDYDQVYHRIYRYIKSTSADDSHQVQMTIIKYLDTSTDYRYLCYDYRSIYVYHTSLSDTSDCIWLMMTIISRYLCCIDDIIRSIPLHINTIISRYSAVSYCINDYHQVDTSAVLMTIIRSIPLLY